MEEVEEASASRSPRATSLALVHRCRKPRSSARVSFAAVRIAKKGDRLVIEIGGGGGYGDPRERDRALVSRDLENEFITESEARDVYRLSQ